MSTQDGWVLDPAIRPARGAADTRPPPDWTTAAAANWRLALDEMPEVNQGHLISGYNDLADTMIASGMPATRYRRNGSLLLGGKPDVPQDAWPQLWNDFQQARKGAPNRYKDIPNTQADFEKWARARQGGRAADTAIASRGGFGTQVLPSLGLGVSQGLAPENLPFMVMGGGGETVAGTLLRQFQAGAVGAAVQAPERADTRAAMGEGYSPNDLAGDIALGGVSNAAIVGAHIAVGKVAGAISDSLPLDVRVARAMDKASPAEVTDREVADAFSHEVPNYARSPDQQAALHVIQRQAEIKDASPYVDTYAGAARHRERIEAAGSALIDPASVPRPQRLGTNIDRAWHAIIGIEGGTNRDGSFRTSPAGAIGPAQIMPGTGPQAAAMAGLPWDPVRYRSDTQYNTALGRAYYEDLLRQFDGDPVKAAAAYNAGPGSAKKGTGLRGAMARAEAAGRPEAWTEYLPHETRDYVANFERRTGITAGDTIDPVRPAVDDDGVMSALDAEQADIERQSQLDDIERSRSQREDSGIQFPPDAHDVELPQLRRDLFPDDASHRIAQAESDAHALGLPEPVVTPETIARDYLAEQAQPVSVKEFVDPAAIKREMGGAVIAPDGRIHVLSGEMPHVDFREALGDEARRYAEITTYHNEFALRRPEAPTTAQLRTISEMASRARREQLHVTEGGVNGSGDLEPEVAERDLASAETAPQPFILRQPVWVAHDGQGLEIGRGPDRPAMAALARRHVGGTVAQQGESNALNATASSEFGDDVTARFADPDGPEAKAQAEGLTHDVKTAYERGDFENVAFSTLAEGHTESAIRTLARLHDEDVALAALRNCM